MSPLELSHNYSIDKKLVVGSASVEKIFRLTDGQRHESDATLNISAVEETYGGSGLCNAVASARTGVLNEIDFITVGGEVNGRPDLESQNISQYLHSQGIKVRFQYHPGKTEQSLIVLSGADDDPKRGFRMTDPNGTLLRDKFKILPNVIDQAATYPLVVASSFHPEVVANFATNYKDARGEKDGIFVWTINKDSASIIKENQYIHQALQSRAIDVMFMSNREYKTINQTTSGQKSLDAVDTIVVTRGSEGCFVRSRLKKTTFEYTTPSFGHAEVLNDNGAGETHHNNFLATLTAVHEQLTTEADLQFKMDVINTAAQIGNLAAFIKIQQEQSLWFPNLNFNLIRDELIRGSKSPKAIADMAFHK